MELPRKFQITGVSSDSPVNCEGIAEFGLNFTGESRRTLRFRALVVPAWEGDVILSWNVLDALGINFIRNRINGRTTHINLSKVNMALPVRLYRKDLAEKARHMTAKIGEAVQEDKIRALQDRIAHGKPPRLDTRKQESQHWKHEMRSLRKTIGPERYQAL